MTLNFLLSDIRQILINYDYRSDEIILQTVGQQTSLATSLQNAIYIIEESNMPSVSNLQFSDIAIYVRRPNPESANTVAQDIYHKLHGRRGNAGVVSAGFAKINIIEALSKPYAFSTNTTGANTTEYVIKFRVQYIDTDFANF